jgi:hypothetical protein
MMRAGEVSALLTALLMSVMSSTISCRLLCFPESPVPTVALRSDYSLTLLGPRPVTNALSDAAWSVRGEQLQCPISDLLLTPVAAETAEPK